MLTLTTDKKTYRFCRCGKKMIVGVDNDEVFIMICPRWLDRTGIKHELYRKEKSNTGDTSESRETLRRGGNI